MLYYLLYHQYRSMQFMLIKWLYWHCVIVFIINWLELLFIIICVDGLDVRGYYICVISNIWIVIFFVLYYLLLLFITINILIITIIIQHFLLILINNLFQHNNNPINKNTINIINKTTLKPIHHIHWQQLLYLRNPLIN